jgi:hypothetical protein
MTTYSRQNFHIREKLALAAFMAVAIILISLPKIGVPVAAAATPAAAQPYQLLAPLPCIPGNPDSAQIPCSAGKIQPSVDFKTYVQYAFNLIIALAAVASVVRLVWGGIEYMSTDAWSGKTEGRKKITSALVGLVLVLSSYIILRTIDPRLVYIPTSLVPKLQLSSQMTTPVSFFDKLAQDAIQNNIESAALATRRNQAQATVNSLQSKLDALTAGGAKDTDPAVQNLKNQIYDQEASVVVLTAQAGMADVTNVGNVGTDAGTFKTLADVTAAKSLVDLAYNNGIDNLQMLGGDSPDNIQAMDDTYYYTYGKLLLQESVLIHAPVMGIQEVNNKVIAGMLNKITDPTEKAALQVQIDSTMTILCNRQFGAPNDPSCKK